MAGTVPESKLMMPPVKLADQPVLYGLNVLARTSPYGVSCRLFGPASDITLALAVAFNNKLTLAKNGSVTKLIARLIDHVILIVLDLLVVAAVAVKLLLTVVLEVYPLGVPVTAEPTTDNPVGKFVAEYVIVLPAADVAASA